MAAFPVLLVYLAVPLAVGAQRTAILSPDMTGHSRSFAEKLGSQLQDKIRILDADLSRTAYASVLLETPFNLTVDESKRVGEVIGCDAFILIRSATQRRSAFGKPEYYEAFAVIYLVSSRTGRLVLWRLLSREAPAPDKAGALLDAEAGELSDEIVRNMRSTVSREINEPPSVTMEEIPEENSPLAKGFRAPVPYRRIKPEYTQIAALYEVAATVEALVDLDALGTVKRVEIVRWAGFGLDESVEKAIRAMNWRPAERNGKPLAMRFLVRYNFKKIEKDPPAQ